MNQARSSAKHRRKSAHISVPQLVGKPVAATLVKTRASDFFASVCATQSIALIGSGVTWRARLDGTGHARAASGALPGDPSPPQETRPANKRESESNDFPAASNRDSDHA